MAEPTLEQACRWLGELADWIQHDPAHRPADIGGPWGQLCVSSLRLALAHLTALDAAREALEEAKEVIRIWHDTVPADGICLPGPEAEETWRLYQESPEMKRINAALAQLKGPNDAD